MRAITKLREKDGTRRSKVSATRSLYTSMNLHGPPGPKGGPFGPLRTRFLGATGPKRGPVGPSRVWFS
jgi:hypothetical protein